MVKVSVWVMVRVIKFWSVILKMYERVCVRKKVHLIQ